MRAKFILTSYKPLTLKLRINLPRENIAVVHHLVLDSLNTKSFLKKKWRAFSNSKEGMFKTDSLRISTAEFFLAGASLIDWGYGLLKCV